MNTESLLNHADEYFEAATRLAQTTPFLFHPVFYCAIHSVELALKGHLYHAGFIAGKLRKKELGHNIDNLLAEALKCKAIDEDVIDLLAQQAVKWGSRDYAGKCFEYPQGMGSTYAIGVWCDIADGLIESLRSKTTIQLT